MNLAAKRARGSSRAKAGLGHRRWPSPRQATLPTSVEQFVRRAAADARSVKAETIELAPAAHHHRRLFEPGAYAALALPARTISRSGTRRRIAVDGLPVRSSRFGVAVCTDVLDHVAEPQTVLDELNRALQANGRLYLTSPLVVDPSDPGGASRGTTRLGMNYLLEAAGFTLHDLQAVRDSSAYAIVAHKARPSATLGLGIPR